MILKEFTNWPFFHKRVLIELLEWKEIRIHWIIFQCFEFNCISCYIMVLKFMHLPFGLSGTVILSPETGMSPPLWIWEYADLASEGVWGVGADTSSRRLKLSWESLSYPSLIALSTWNDHEILEKSYQREKNVKMEIWRVR